MPDLLDFQLVNLGGTTSVPVPNIGIECRVVNSNDQSVELANYQGPVRRIMLPQVLLNLPASKRARVYRDLLERIFRHAAGIQEIEDDT